MPLKKLMPLLQRKLKFYVTNLCRVAVHVGSGSRHETLATSGAAHVLRNLLTRGTQSHSSA